MNIERDYPINALDDNVVANEAQGVSKKVAGQRLTMILIRQWTVKTGTRFMVFIYKILHSDGLQVCFQGITHFIVGHFQNRMDVFAYWTERGGHRVDAYKLFECVWLHCHADTI